MGKKLSANELQKHTDRLLKGEEDKVNSLIEKLEEQKNYLQKEDSSIIDWAIEAVKNKSRDKSTHMAENSLEISNQDYDDFIKKLRWTGLNSDQIYHRFNALIGELLVLSKSNNELLRSLVENSTTHLETFCLKSGWGNYSDNVKFQLGNFYKIKSNSKDVNYNKVSYKLISEVLLGR